MAKVTADNPGEVEFLQAVREVVESLADFLNENPKYVDAKILERMVEPERAISFRVPWVDDKGEIQISSEVFTTITGAVATSCFGVKGMAARSKKDGLVHLLRSESMAKGVRVIFEEDDTVSIELHIIVDAGVNLTAVSSSIMSEVRYAVGNMTGAQVRAVDVYVDSMEID